MRFTQSHHLVPVSLSGVRLSDLLAWATQARSERLSMEYREDPDGYALSYAQDRNQAGDWMEPHCLAAVLRILQTDHRGAWFDRMAVAQLGGETEWATFGLLPYTRFTVFTLLPTKEDTDADILEAWRDRQECPGITASICD